MKNDRLIRALLKQPVDKTPIWIMRQAGRYLPEYREIRQSVSGFMDLCQNPELACEVTMQPLRRFDLDAAILFSDILTIPDAMGLGLHFVAGEGPKFHNPIKDAADVKALKKVSADSELSYVTDAVCHIKKALKDSLPLIGFSGSPWTLATYMVEGGPSKNFSKIKRMLYQRPDLLHQILSVLTDSVIDYLNAQIECGANCVMLFDSWGGVLTPTAYEQFSLQYMEKIISEIKKENHEGIVPNIVFTKGGGLWLEKIATCGANALGLDWTIDIRDAKKRVGQQVALQGNLDPSILYADGATIKEEAKKILSNFKLDEGHIFNLGHGIHPDISPDNVKTLVDYVKHYHD